MTRSEAQKVQASIQAGEKVDPEVMAEAMCVLGGCGAKPKLEGMTLAEQVDKDCSLCDRLDAACVPARKVA